MSTMPVSQCQLVWRTEVTSEMLILRTFELGMAGEIKYLFSKGWTFTAKVSFPSVSLFPLLLAAEVYLYHKAAELETFS